MLRPLEPKETENWSEHISELLMVYNSTPHASSETCPHFLLFGRDVGDKLPADLIHTVDMARRRQHHLGRAKILDQWSVEKYEVLRTATFPGGPYTIKKHGCTEAPIKGSYHELRRCELGANV